MVDTVYRLDIPVTLALLGDMHGRTYQDVINSMEKHQPDVILIVGDIQYGAQPLEDRSPLGAQLFVLCFWKNGAAWQKPFSPLETMNGCWMKRTSCRSD